MSAGAFVERFFTPSSKEVNRLFVDIIVVVACVYFQKLACKRDVLPLCTTVAFVKRLLSTSPERGLDVQSS